MKNTLSKRYGLKFFIDFILIVLVVFLVLVFIGTIKVYHTETFTSNMNNNNQLVPEDFTKNGREQLLLYGDYDVKENTEVTKNNNFNIWKDYPVYPSSFKQMTNNRKTWTTPDMGTCSPAEFCGTPYKETEQQKEIVSNPVPLNANVTRINWWAANSCE
jgi:cell division protein FtsI/penicillin-binding protein 2